MKHRLYTDHLLQVPIGLIRPRPNEYRKGNLETTSGEYVHYELNTLSETPFVVLACGPSSPDRPTRALPHELARLPLVLSSQWFPLHEDVLPRLCWLGLDTLAQPSPAMSVPLASQATEARSGKDCRENPKAH